MSSEPVLIEIECPACGPVLVHPEEIGFRYEPPTRARGMWTAPCPDCGAGLMGGAGYPDLVRLVSLGARETGESMPFELLEPHDGGPVSWDELFELHEYLDTHCCPQEQIKLP
jgi:hypothetical protein